MNPVQHALRSLAAAALAIVLAGAGCATVPDTDRSQILLLSPEEEVRMGLHAYEEVRRELDMVESGPQKEQVERIGRRIVDAADRRLAARGFDSLDWEYNVVDDEQANAFVLPGGKVVFYTGLLDLAESDDEVAAVMGHEVAHVIARHAGERLSQNILISTGLGVAEAALSDSDSGTGRATMAALGVGAVVGVQLPFSRTHEAESDEIGLYLMAEAGYDPRAAVSFWQRMEERNDSGPPAFLSTHPAPADRIANLESLLPEAMEVYRAR